MSYGISIGTVKLGKVGSMAAVEECACWALTNDSGERLLSSDKYREPNPDCPVCSVSQSRLLVDMSRATLRDLVEDFLKLQLGYGEEIVVNNESGLLYDVEETENLDKKLSELGTFLLFSTCIYLRMFD